MNKKYQSIILTKANGTAAGTTVTEVTLNKEMKNVTAIAGYLHPTKTGGSTVRKSIQLNMGADLIQDDTITDDYTATTAMGFSDRYKPYDFPCDGRVLKISLTNDIALTADFQFELILRCENN